MAFSLRNFGQTSALNGTSRSSEKIRSSERPIGKYPAYTILSAPLTVGGQAGGDHPAGGVKGRVTEGRVRLSAFWWAILAIAEQRKGLRSG